MIFLNFEPIMFDVAEKNLRSDKSIDYKKYFRKNLN